MMTQGSVIVKCDNCGQEFIKPISRVNEHNFCNKKCYGMWKEEKIAINCVFCGNEFKRSKVHAKRRENRFCSKSCFNDWQRVQNSQKIECDNCGKEVKRKLSQIQKVNNHFCSLSCSGEWFSAHYHPTEETRVKMGETHKGEKNSMFGRRGGKHPQWKGGISFEPYCEKFNESFKESIREKFGRICFLCPTTEKENGQKLSVHHVDYNKNCLCDESECKFVPLCKSCHSKTGRNREYWEEIIINKLQDLGKESVFFKVGVFEHPCPTDLIVEAIK